MTSSFVYPAFVVAGRSDEEIAWAESETRRQIAFYATTPAYRPVLDLHGWGDLQSELRGLSKADRWEEVGTLIDDRILDSFAVRADIDDVPAELQGRFGGLVDRIRLYMPGGSATTAERIMGGLVPLPDQFPV